MGEVAEMMIDGTLCQGCGIFLNESAPGHPCHCYECAAEGKADNKARRISEHHKQQAAQKKIPCEKCGRRVKVVGMADHIRDSHSEPAAQEPEQIDPRSAYKPAFEVFAKADGTYHLRPGEWRRVSNGGVPVVDFFRPYKQDRTMHTFEGFMAGFESGRAGLVDSLREIAKYDSSEGRIAMRALDAAKIEY